MEAVFKYELDKSEIEKIEKYCNSVEYCAAEQFIGWNDLLYKSKIRYFYLIDDSGIKSFSQITEKFGSAQISFGPVCCDKEMMVVSLNEIIQHYKKEHYYYLGIQMYFKSGFDLDYIEYQLNKKHEIEYLFNSENTKTSIEIDLSQSVEVIFNHFGKKHRNSIRKAQKLGITVNVVDDDIELEALKGIFTRMYDKRDISDEAFFNNIFEINKYLIINNKGQSIVAKDSEGIIIGGIVVIYQGNTLRLYKSASDPERHDIPINHLLIYEIIKMAKDSGFKYLDLWGYNHFVNENDQVYRINRFKRGFGGYFTFFAKKMHIELIPMGTKIYWILQTIRKVTKQKM